MSDYTALPVEAQEHLRRCATPAHLAMTVTADLADDVKWKPARHLMYLNEIITAACLSPRQEFIDLELSVRHGKALALDTPVPTPSGWATIGELAVGDEVFDDHGEVCRVIAKSPVFRGRPCFAVSTDDGDSIVADAEHEWPVSLSDTYHNRAPEVDGPCPLCPRTFDTARGRSTHMARSHGMSPAMLAETSAVRCHTSADLAERRAKYLSRGRSDRPKSLMRAVLKTDSPTLPCDPWVLGFWLGDGTSVHGSVTIGQQDAAEIRRLFAAAGYTTTDRTNPTQFGVLGLKVQLREAGVLANKHVPVEYLRASPVDRLALLQGLIDSDGHVAAKGQVEFCTTRRVLAEGVQELVRSLGYKASVCEGRATLNGRDCGSKWRVLFYMPDCARLERKRSRTIEPVRRDRFLTVEPTERADTQCIQVDSPSHCFLVGRGMVPTHNSFLVSGYTAAWYIGMFPDRRVALLSYNADKAAEWGEFTMEIIAEWGPTLFGISLDPNKRSKGNWGIKGRRGEIIATGLGGTITGKGFDLAVIDDPIKNREDADSAAERKKLRDGYYSNVRTRLSPHGTVVLAMARWREDDLAGDVVHGYNAADDLTDAAGDVDEWNVVRFPALAECPQGEDPKSWRDELGRADGDPLWPELWPKELVEKMRNTMLRNDPQAWYSLYQQNPTSKEGRDFKKDKWVIFPEVDRSRLRLVRQWDLAATKDGGDWTVGALVGMDNDGKTYVLDIQRFRKESSEVEKHIRLTAENDGIAIPVRIEQEKSGSGKAVASTYTRLLVGFDVQAKQPEGNKEVRASAYAAQQQQERVVLLRAPWNDDFIEEHRMFPKGRWDDQVDAVSAGFNNLAIAGPTVIEATWQGNTPLASLYGNHRAAADPIAAARARVSR